MYRRITKSIIKNAQAFTLIELLVVIAIIALLLAILLPSMNLARMHAKRIASASNMRQIGLALQLYAEDNRGFFPETTHGLTGQAARKRSWIFTLSPYVGDVNEIRICPADPKRKERLANGFSSYVLNEYIAVDNIDPFGRIIGTSYRNMFKLKRPSETITTFIGADDLSVSITSDHTHSRLWFLPTPNVPWNTIRKDIQPDRYHTNTTPDNTSGSSLYLYVDSRVETIKAKELKEMADRFENFAKPKD
jgi:prepilin-type N-terminal cleavage/methylation domain-containing protein